MSDLDVCFAEALADTSSLLPGAYATFRARFDLAWIEEALGTTGTATLRKRRLPAERVVWLVIGMAHLRDRPIAEVVRQLDLALPSRDGQKTVASSSTAQARARLDAEPLEWLSMRRRYASPTATRTARSSAVGMQASTETESRAGSAATRSSEW